MKLLRSCLSLMALGVFITGATWTVTQAKPNTDLEGLIDALSVGSVIVGEECSWDATKQGDAKCVDNGTCPSVGTITAGYQDGATGTPQKCKRHQEGNQVYCDCQKTNGTPL
jgi:hypothetical protein